MTIQMIPLDKLYISPANVRKTGAKDGIQGLALSIKAHGLLQNLTVEPGGEKDTYSVLAGGRRLAALEMLRKDEQIETGYLVPCNVIELYGDIASDEISLAENEMRAPMHPADQFDAFKKLADEGQGPDTIAAKFGVTPRVVEQRLKMTTVSPKLIDAFRKGELKLEHVMALTLTDDQKRQEKICKDLPKWAREDGREGADMIRGEITEEMIDANDNALAKFVTVKAYEEAGGTVVRDLFDAEDKGHLTDHALLNRLATEKLEKIAEKMREEGWKWADIRASTDHVHTGGFGRLKADYGDAKYTKADMAKSGVLVCIGYDGKVDYKRGLLKAEDMKEIKKEAKAKGKKSSTDVAEAPKAKDPNALSAELMKFLTTHRTAALQAKLAVNPKIALIALVHRLVIDTILLGSGGSVVKINPHEYAIYDDDAPDMKGVLAVSEMKTATKNAQKGLPQDDEKLWDWLLKQDQKRLLEILAICVASTVDAVDRKRGSGDDELAADHANQLAEALKLDMTEYWEPTAANYFERISSAQIMAAVTEACGKTEAQTLTGMKKPELAKAETTSSGFHRRKSWPPSPKHAAKPKLRHLPG
jgi:ParB family chromosome partitioning protein